MNLLRRIDLLLLLLALAVSAMLHAYFSGPSAEELSSELQLGPGCTVLSSDSPPPPASPAKKRTPSKAAPPVRFLMYNVHDYFVEKDPQRSRHPRKIKTKAQREAVAEVIASVRPEVIGLVEIGGPAALDDLAERLAARGLNYPHRKALTRWGEDRALGILSMHPIVADHSVANCKLLGNSSRQMLRGILDVSVQPAGDERVFRIIGAHLKSRVSNDPSAADALRAREARTLVAHITTALTHAPDTALLVYGDWNDGPKAISLAPLTRGSAPLKRLSPQDAQGETWTIFYKDGQEYNAFDQLYVSPALSKSMGLKSQSGIVSQPPGKTQPSDHRAVWCDMR